MNCQGEVSLEREKVGKKERTLLKREMRFKVRGCREKVTGWMKEGRHRWQAQGVGGAIWAGRGSSWIGQQGLRLADGFGQITRWVGV